MFFYGVHQAPATISGDSCHEHIHGFLPFLWRLMQENEPAQPLFGRGSYGSILSSSSSGSPIYCNLDQLLRCFNSFSRRFSARSTPHQ